MSDEVLPPPEGAKFFTCAFLKSILSVFGTANKFFLGAQEIL